MDTTDSTNIPILWEDQMIFEKNYENYGNFWILPKSIKLIPLTDGLNRKNIYATKGNSPPVHSTTLEQLTGYFQQRSLISKKNYQLQFQFYGSLYFKRVLVSEQSHLQAHLY